MKLTYPDYYLAFRCSASGCEDNCCIGWEIDIDERAYADYMARGGVFGQRLRGSIAQGEAPHFLLQEERCPFLNEQNLCDIILNLGESALCEICTQHPRFHEWFGDIKESGVGLCCEEAAKLILQSDGPTTFIQTEIDEPADPDFEDEPLLNALLAARDMLFALLQDCRFSIWDRLAAALVFAEQLQAHLEEEAAPERIRAWVEARQEAPGGFMDKAQGQTRPAAEGTERRILGELLAFYQTLEPIDSGWPDQLGRLRAGLSALLAERKGFLQVHRACATEYEHLAVYFVYRYMLKSVYDGDVLGKIKLMAASVLLIAWLDIAHWHAAHAFCKADQVRLAKRYSKEIEYCEENLQRFADASWDEGFLSMESLAVLLEGMAREA